MLEKDFLIGGFYCPICKKNTNHSFRITKPSEYAATIIDSIIFFAKLKKTFHCLNCGNDIPIKQDSTKNDLIKAMGKNGYIAPAPLNNRSDVIIAQKMDVIFKAIKELFEKYDVLNTPTNIESVKKDIKNRFLSYPLTSQWVDDTVDAHFDIYKKEHKKNNFFENDVL